jgi:tripartite-type tricarboxylate transporter receptor subunit TctC
MAHMSGYNRLIFAMLIMLLVKSAYAQAYPDKPIRLVIPFAAGGAADQVARVVAPYLSAELGQPIVLDNRAGAGGTIGAGLVAGASPDGYTLLFSATGPNGIAPSIYSKLSYDPLRSFAWISRVSVQPAIIVVNPSLGVKSLGDLVAMAKAAPAKLNFGTPGIGTSSHLGGEMFKAVAGVDLLHVPYKAGPLARTDLLNGTIHVIFDNIAPLISFVKNGRLRALAVASKQRTPLLPELPTTAEAGVPGFEYSIWFGMGAPAGTPQQLVQSMNKVVVKVLQDLNIEC